MYNARRRYRARPMWCRRQSGRKVELLHVCAWCLGAGVLLALLLVLR